MARAASFRPCFPGFQISLHMKNGKTNFSEIPTNLRAFFISFYDREQIVARIEANIAELTWNETVADLVSQAKVKEVEPAEEDTLLPWQYKFIAFINQTEVFKTQK